MTAKQEAEELVNKFVKQPIDFPYIDAEHDHCIGSGYMTHNSAKQCAHIAMNKLLEYSKAHGFIGLTEHYKQVKIEIENL